MRLTNVEILFEAKKAKRVLTNAIAGEYTAFEGLVAMTEGTRCEVVQVSDGETFAIKFIEAIEPGGDLNETTEELLLETDNQMNFTKRKENIGSAFFKGVFTVAATVITSALAQDADSDEVFELSPFEIDASEDTGYRANSTLAGSRLNTQLRDVAASVTVLTSEFLDDIGATGVEDALAFVASAETGQTFESNQTAGYVGGGQATQPSRNRMRGLSQADVTSDFFSTSNPHFDTYNVDRLSVVRGPNSVLFGLGSPSGIINYTTKKASVGSDFGEIRLTLDNHDTVRGQFDYNKILAEDKLAVRVMGLSADKGFQYDRAYDRDKRATIALTYKPSSRTDIRFAYEKIDIESRRPRYIIPEDHITRWVEGGAPTFDTGNNPGVPFTDYFDEIGIVSARNGLFFTDLTTPGPDFAMKLENIRTTLGRMPTSQRITMRRSSNPDDGLNFFTVTHVTDERVFPYKDVDLATLPGNWQTQDSHSKSVVLNHSFSDDFHIEAGWYADNTVRDNLAQITSRTAMIAVDVNETLTDGTTNPNFLRPFISGRGVGNLNDQENETFRFQASYELDFAEISDTSWLGKHRLSALYSDTSFEEFRYAWEPRINALNHPAFTGDNALLNNSGRRITAIYYVADALQPGQIHPNYTGFPETELVPEGMPFPLTYYDDVNDVWLTDDRPVETQRIIHTNNGWNTRDNEGLGVALQSFFWNDKIVTMLGYRDDDVTGNSTAAPSPGTGGGSDGLPPIDRALWSFDDPPLETSGSTLTKGIVFHATDWLSFHHNESENFVVSPPKVDILGRPIPASSGEGKDYGFSLNLFENKMNVKVNWFETNQLDSEDGGLGFVGFWRMRGFERGIYSRIMNEDWIDTNPELTWMRWDGSTTENHERFPNVSDVRDFQSEGLEIEMIYNPTSNWRIMFNASRQETVQANTGAAMLEYIALREPYWDQFWDLPWNTQRTVRQQFSNAVGSRLFPALAANGRISQDQAKWSWNAVTNYRFSEGRFRGFSAGGSMRWTDKRAIGYALSEDEDGNVITDLDQPFFGGTNLNVGVHGAFAKKIFNDTVDWKIQLNIQNLIGDSDRVVIRKNPDGNSAAFRVGREPIYKLTSTFKF